jgi:hypothetical protein
MAILQSVVMKWITPGWHPGWMAGLLTQTIIAVGMGDDK